MSNTQNLKSEFKYLKYNYDNHNFEFISDNGVYSKSEISKPSRILVEQYIKSGRRNIKLLDIGCGYGFIGIVLSKIMDCDITLSDNNLRALHLASINLDRNSEAGRVIESDAYSNISDKFDVIITNPPCNAGKDKLKEILDASNHLNLNGEIWFVMHKNQGVLSMIKYLKSKYQVTVIYKIGGFYVICLKVS